MRAALAVPDDFDRTLARAREGDPVAFAALVRRHQDMVFSLAWHALRNRAAAEDLAQEVFLQLYRDLARIESAAHLIAWLRRVASHRCIDELRRLPRRMEVAVDALPDRPGPAAAASEVFLDRRLRALIGRLPAGARMVMLLRYQEDLDPSEIADTLNMPVNTVKSHLRRSLSVLRAQIVRELNHEP
jgi:RNA polymerase sigma-70 factor, ECF subfamily